MSTTNAHHAILVGSGQRRHEHCDRIRAQKSPAWIERRLLVVAILLMSPVCCTADIYQIDPANSFITFSVKHLGLNSIKGQFKQVEGAIILNNGAIAEGRATIQVKSVDTGLQQRDDQLRSADYFDALKYPTISFETKRITKNRVYGKRHNIWDGGITVIGLLTMHGVSRELRFTAKQSGPTKDASGNVRIGLEAKTKLKRKNFGIAFQQPLETGTLVVGEDVEIGLSVQAIKQETPL